MAVINWGKKRNPYDIHHRQHFKLLHLSVHRLLRLPAKSKKKQAFYGCIHMHHAVCQRFQCIFWYKFSHCLYGLESAFHKPIFWAEPLSFDSVKHSPYVFYRNHGYLCVTLIQIVLIGEGLTARISHSGWKRISLWGGYIGAAERLSPFGFCHIQRSCIVNLKYITGVNSREVTLCNGAAAAYWESS